MNAKFTPGPWAAAVDRDEDDCDWNAITDSKGRLIARVEDVDLMKSKIAYRILTPGDTSILDVSDEVDANARLIAAAPELLEALRKIDANLAEREYDPEDTLRAIAIAAIAKATGQEVK